MSTAVSRRRRRHVAAVLSAVIAPLGLCATSAQATHNSSTTPQSLAVPGSYGPESIDLYTEEPNENLVCSNVSMIRTAWFYFTGTGGTVHVTTANSSFDTVVAVYERNLGGRRYCNDDIDYPNGIRTSEVYFPTTAGVTYFAQIGACSGQGCGSISGTYWITARKADLDGDGDDVDCNDSNPSIKHGAAEILKDGIDQNCSLPLDADDDGYAAGPVPHGDCDDGNPSLNPSETDIPHDGPDQNCDGADDLDADNDNVNKGLGPNLDCDDDNSQISPRLTEVPGNRVDEDCAGGPRPGALARAPNIRLPSIAVRGGRRFETLSVSNIARGFTVTVRCEGSGRCPRRQIKTARSTQVRFGAYDKRVLRAGAKVRIFITRPDGFFYGVFKQYRVRRGSAKPRQTNCQLHPDRPTAPIRCSS